MATLNDSELLARPQAGRLARGRPRRGPGDIHPGIVVFQAVQRRELVRRMDLPHRHQRGPPPVKAQAGRAGLPQRPRSRNKPAHRRRICGLQRPGSRETAKGHPLPPHQAATGFQPPLLRRAGIRRNRRNYRLHGGQRESQLSHRQGKNNKIHKLDNVRTWKRNLISTE